MTGDVPESALADSLTSIGIDPTSLAVVSDSREPVYEVRSTSGRYFVKVLKEEKGDALRDVLDRDLVVGMPDCRLIRDGDYVLITDPASGWPLSLSLPASLLPGPWWILSDSLARSVRAVGVNLGELHSGTRMGDCRVDDEACRMADRLAIERPIRERFSSETIAELNRLFDELREMHLPFARIHGDPTPHNIFWNAGAGEAEIIDFNLHTSVAAEDLAVFESGIELMTARLPYARRSQETALIESFHAGYVESGVHERIPERTVTLLKIAHFTRLLSKYLGADSPDDPRDRVTRYTDTRILERKIRSLASQL